MAEPYFVRIQALTREGGDGAVPDGPVAAHEIPLARGSARATAKILAGLFALGGAVAGFAAPALIAFALSITFSPALDGSDVAFLAGIGVLLAAGGIALGVATYLPWRATPALGLGQTSFTLRYPGFRTSLVVPRELVRVVAIDDTPVRPFRPNHRFAIRGEVPADAFGDALGARRPWGVTGAALPFTPPPAETPREAHLFGPGGSSLPFLRVNPEDVPNVAILLHEPIRTPRAPNAIGLVRTAVFPGGRRIRGMLVRVADLRAATTAFGDWGVVREIDASDVVDEGLVVPQPLRGLLGSAWTATAIIPIIGRILSRHTRRL